ncbi:hypothetical protein A2154_01455 [Candidatus Gottesmanbacteria bacterium RBG_16_43_7]|uniref:Signal transduction histidine kinase dimerisation/phosphoacceptor domain-containing protein n=1 Tax=Candidatus Gottesmanbacteria bacterium RBG_16_43_7 TaxID=1798373 RepID=A0A1F5ZB43_9BACT|nr:MAG: hypothetical protein A2154_01455 [Candidatus Gottesmanbacteria bacterium RBG_16_43_7]
MFQKARIKLTTLYLTIIMSVSLMFSLAMYRVLSFEISRFERMQRLRLERQLEEGEFFLPSHPRGPFFPVPDPDLLAETRQRIILSLVTVNGIVLVLSGGLGYMLAGRTLRPIETMVDEQNRFITDASHELKTPLTSLRLSMEVFLRSKKQSLSEAIKNYSR